MFKNLKNQISDSWYRLRGYKITRETITISTLDFASREYDEIIQKSGRLEMSSETTKYVKTLINLVNPDEIRSISTIEQVFETYKKIPVVIVQSDYYGHVEEDNYLQDVLYERATVIVDGYLKSNNLLNSFNKLSYMMSLFDKYDVSYFSIMYYAAGVVINSIKSFKQALYVSENMNFWLIARNKDKLEAKLSEFGREALEVSSYEELMSIYNSLEQMDQFKKSILDRIDVMSPDLVSQSNGQKLVDLYRLAPEGSILEYTALQKILNIVGSQN